MHETHKLRTGYAQGYNRAMFWRSRPRRDIYDVLQRVKLLEDGLAALEDRHERLRGRFYATRPQLHPETESRPETKQEILTRMGFAGRGRMPPPGST